MQGVPKTSISSVVCFSYIPCLCVVTLNLSPLLSSPTGNGTYCTLRLASSAHIETAPSLSDALLLCKRLSHLAVSVAVGNKYQDTPEEKTPSRRRHMVGHGSLPALVECSAWGRPVVLVGGAAASLCQVCLSGMYQHMDNMWWLLTYFSSVQRIAAALK